MKALAWCCSLVGLLLVCGCADSESSISGNVIVDGKPVAEGDIRFIPMAGTIGADAGAVIRDGRYKLVAKGLAAGKYRVSIRGYKQSGRMEPDPLGGPPIKGTVQIVPKEYQGEESKVVKEIIRGDNRFDFDLMTSRPQQSSP
jgi:hypothetical protein